MNVFLVAALLLHGATAEKFNVGSIVEAKDRLARRLRVRFPQQHRRKLPTAHRRRRSWSSPAPASNAAPAPAAESMPAPTVTSPALCSTITGHLLEDICSGSGYTGVLFGSASCAGATCATSDATTCCVVAASPPAAPAPAANPPSHDETPPCVDDDAAVITIAAEYEMGTVTGCADQRIKNIN